MNQLTPIQHQDKLQERAHSILDYCKAFEIEDDQDYQMADLKVVECKNLMKVIKIHHDPVCEATNKAHKAATNLRKNLFDPPDQASKILSTKMGNYKQQRDAERAEEQRLLDEKAKEDHDADCEKEAKAMEEKDYNVADELQQEGQEQFKLAYPYFEIAYRANPKSHATVKALKQITLRLELMEEYEKYKILEKELRGG